MKWGKTNAQVEEGREPNIWFAWHPVHLQDGRWAWLEKVEREYAGPSIMHSGWLYRNI